MKLWFLFYGATAYHELFMDLSSWKLMLSLQNEQMRWVKSKSKNLICISIPLSDPKWNRSRHINENSRIDGPTFCFRNRFQTRYRFNLSISFILLNLAFISLTERPLLRHFRYWQSFFFRTFSLIFKKVLGYFQEYNINMHAACF